MTAPKKAGFSVSPFLNVPTLIVINTLRLSGRTAVISAQAGRSLPVTLGAMNCLPHSVSCQTTPAFGPMTCSSQLAKERPGSFASRSEAGIARTKDNACFSKESICGAPIIKTHNRFVIANSFKPVMALEVELHRELDNAWFIRRGEARELARRYLRTAFDADIRKPQLIEEERAVGHAIHLLEVGPVEEIESVKDELEPERVVAVEADSPSYSQISGEEPGPEARVASYRERAVVVVGVEVNIDPSSDVEWKTAARRDTRRQVKIGERPSVPGIAVPAAEGAFEDSRNRQPVTQVERRESTIGASVGRVLWTLLEVDVGGVSDRFAIGIRPDHLVVAAEAFVHRQ